jgi:pantothenate synthetase
MRHQALCLYQSIQAAKRMVDNGGGTNITAAAVVELIQKTVEEAGCRLEYAVVVNEHSLQPEAVVGNGSVLAIAVKVGGTVRLIDNAQLLPGKMR